MRQPSACSSTPGAPYFTRSANLTFSAFASLRCQWTTSSARDRSDGGIVSPSVLAVLTLMTSSNFVGCPIGRSAGFAPCY